MEACGFEGLLRGGVVRYAQNHVSVLFRAGHKGVEIFHIDIAVVQHLQGLGELAGLIADLDPHHLRGVQQVSLVGEGLPRRFVIVDDEPKNAEITGVGDGKGTDIDVVGGEGVGDGYQGALLVFHENR